jgi:hypothetical protein
MAKKDGSRLPSVYLLEFFLFKPPQADRHEDRDFHKRGNQLSGSCTTGQGEASSFPGGQKSVFQCFLGRFGVQ